MKKSRWWQVRTALMTWIIALCFMNTAWAMTTPLDLLGGISTRIITELDRNKATINTKPAVVYGIVNRLFLPHVDTVSMSRSVLGPTVWRQASATERQQFSHEFVTLVVRTYATALAEYNDETVKFLPMRDDPEVSSRVEVESRIIRRGAPAIAVSYRLRRVASTWQVYDIAVENVSLVRSYRSQFSSKIARIGLSGLIKELRNHNMREQQ